MFYMCKSNDGVSHGNKTVSVRSHGIYHVYLICLPFSATNIYTKGYMQHICTIYAKQRSFCVMIYDLYMIAICFYAINMRNTHVATYVLYMFTYEKFTRMCM